VTRYRNLVKYKDSFESVFFYIKNLKSIRLDPFANLERLTKVVQNALNSHGLDEYYFYKLYVYSSLHYVNETFYKDRLKNRSREETANEPCTHVKI
jgi:hypothetical protein